MGFFDFLKNNMSHVAPVLLCGIFALAVIIERSRALFKTYPLKNQREFFSQISDLLSAGQTQEALALCDRNGKKPVAKIVKAGLLRAHLPEDLLHHGVELALGDAQHAVGKRTAFLATVANVATLLGLFGTILGLVHSFEAVGHADPQQKSAMLASGIATALNATMLGLGVAIPCMVAFAFLMNRSNDIVTDLENASVRVVDLIQQRYYAAESDGESAAPVAPETSESNGVSNGNGKVVNMRRSA